MVNFPMAKQTGFTLVELVTTIILISILAVTVLPRLFTQSSYSAYSLRNEFIAELRQVQQKALNNTDRCYRLAVSSSGYQASQFAGRSSTGCTGAAISPDPLYVQAFEGGASLALVSNGASGFNIDFDTNGRPSLGCNGHCIKVTANETVIINISSEGYIYAN
ncbi:MULTISPECIES: prepilin-type N-terminal cleavage/methylation domain-containing protein [unclassified Shewanella]|uniref:type II secretion system protein n=1 Tax=unclassified Shewanella TaxID=196818 RepID=UPI0015E2BD70|nr:MULTISPECIES: prepilin-type N-terminal cleavage/methylation domain-containing protein [unclassified Shewanella]